MPQFAESQAVFASALFDPAHPVPADLRCLGAPAEEDRFAVYRNNVMVGLTEALRDAYPVVCRLVGEEFFRAMAGIFARANPPASPVMLDYGAGFAEFIAGFPPAAQLPYLADVARLERAWVEAYHAAEAETLEHASALPATRLTLHPATRLVRTAFPVLAVWHANRQDWEPEALELMPGGENVLITRPHAEVQACCIPDEAADLIEVIKTGALIVPSVGDHLIMLCSLGAFAARSAS